MSHDDAVRARFAGTAPRAAEEQSARSAALAERLRRFVTLGGSERVLDVGTGVGAVAIALAPHVAEVTGVDVVPEVLDQARELARGVENVRFAEADAGRLPFPVGAFDLVTCVRTLHHVARPELVVAELARVVRPGGRILVVDQLAPPDPVAAAALERFERARDASFVRLLPEVDLRHLFEANDLVLERAQVDREPRDVERYLELAGCHGAERDTARNVAPRPYVQEVGWYLLVAPGAR